MTSEVKEGFTVGIGLTNRCNANCPHCYSRPENVFSDIDFDTITELARRVPIRSVNFGTGESIFYPKFRELTKVFVETGIPISLTSNGETTRQLSDSELSIFHDIDFSLDFPDEMSNDRWRGEGYFRRVMSEASRSRSLGIDTSIVMCLMNINHHLMKTMLDLVNGMGMNLRINVYKAVITHKYRLSYEEFWKAIRDLCANGVFISCSEPIVNAAMKRMNRQGGHPCGNHSFRIKPDGKVVPCVYLNGNNVTLEQIICDYETYRLILREDLQLPIPEICGECEYLTICCGGCASRRILNNPAEPDEFCFIKKGEYIDLKPRWAKSKGLIHEDYLCTMILSA